MRRGRTDAAAVALGQPPPRAIPQHQEAVMTVASQAQARGQRASERAESREEHTTATATSAIPTLSLPDPPPIVQYPESSP